MVVDLDRTDLLRQAGRIPSANGQDFRAMEILTSNCSFFCVCMHTV